MITAHREPACYVLLPASRPPQLAHDHKLVCSQAIEWSLEIIAGHVCFLPACFASDSVPDVRSWCPMTNSLRSLRAQLEYSSPCVTLDATGSPRERLAGLDRVIAGFCAIPRQIQNCKASLSKVGQFPCSMSESKSKMHIESHDGDRNYNKQTVDWNRARAERPLCSAT